MNKITMNNQTLGPGVSVIPGDVNGDGVVDQVDATLLWNWVSFRNERETTYKLPCPWNADVNGDGIVNIGDAVLLMNWVKFPNERGTTYKFSTPDRIFICNEGAKRNPTTLGDGSVIYAEVCRNNAWVPTGDTGPTKPECTEGDKKAGYVCVAGKWRPTPAVPGPVPPVEPTPYQPGPPVMPPADGMFTIEFQEMIPGVKPPRMPLLVPGLETLPLLPGWIVRDAAGNIVNRGVELPTLPGSPGL